MRWLDDITDLMAVKWEQALGTGDGQGNRVCCSPWGQRELDSTELTDLPLGLSEMWVLATEMLEGWLSKHSISVIGDVRGDPGEDRRRHTKGTGEPVFQTETDLQT